MALAASDTPLARWLSARELLDEMRASEPARQPLQVVIRDWSLRSRAQNDDFLGALFTTLLEESAKLEIDERLIAYDASEASTVVIGELFCKRLDARRKTKPKSGKPQMFVRMPFDPTTFNFSKVNPREKLLALQLLPPDAPAVHGLPATQAQKIGCSWTPRPGSAAGPRAPARLAGAGVSS